MKITNKFCISSSLCYAFPIHNSLKERDDLLSSLFNFTLEYAITKAQHKCHNEKHRNSVTD